MIFPVNGNQLDLASNLQLFPANRYTFEQLADIYNQTRIDYIVPMPMNKKRMDDYVRFYDIDMALSTVVLNDQKMPAGMIMIGVRGDHAWITRLGVMPDQRGHRIGQSLMERSMEKLKTRKIRRVQLEVIKGNQPAERLFLKLGFVPQRELLVLRRPPQPIINQPLSVSVVSLDLAEISACLQSRELQIAWTEATASLLNIQTLKGFSLSLPSGESGWIIYQMSAFELTHVVLNPDASVEMIRALISALHSQHPMHDTKIENLSSDHPAFSEFQRVGYLEVFRRIEMVFDLGY